MRNDTQPVAELIGHIWSEGTMRGLESTLLIRKNGVWGGWRSWGPHPATTPLTGFVSLDAPSAQDPLNGWARLDRRGHLTVATPIVWPKSHQGLFVQCAMTDWIKFLYTEHYASIDTRRQEVLDGLVKSLEARLQEIRSLAPSSQPNA